MIYETYEEILGRMLSNVPSGIDKREGSIIYNALAPAAVELAEANIKLRLIEDRTYADTAVGDDLTRRAAERGIVRDAATYAVRRGIFNIDVPIGSRFNSDDLNYIVLEKITTGEYKLQCESTGEIGNLYSGQLIPIDYIDGLETASLSDIIILGEDEEDDMSLRKKYFDSLESESFGGNIADYKKKSNELPGVGGTKVYPVWNGGGTVKLVIINSDYNKPSTALVDNVQTAMDPVVNQGKGLGIAPIGHRVTVEAITENVINIQSNITLQNGYVWGDVEPGVYDIINTYFNELNKTWDDNDNLVVRISQIETRILNITGVLDIQNTLLNSLAENLILAENEIAILGGVINSAS